MPINMVLIIVLLVFGSNFDMRANKGGKFTRCPKGPIALTKFNARDLEFFRRSTEDFVSYVDCN